jgi:hypothetical protein
MNAIGLGACVGFRHQAVAFSLTNASSRESPAGVPLPTRLRTRCVKSSSTTARQPPQRSPFCPAAQIECTSEAAPSVVGCIND